MSDDHVPLSTDAYDEGFAASLEGKSKTNNPYPTDINLHYEWLDGWQDAYDQGDHGVGEPE